MARDQEKCIRSFSVPQIKRKPYTQCKDRQATKEASQEMARTERGKIRKAKGMNELQLGTEVKDNKERFSSWRAGNDNQGSCGFTAR